MKIKYEANKGQRIKYGFLEMSTYGCYWWNIDLNKWEHSDVVDFNKHEYDDGIRCKTIRAFRRRLKSAPNIQFYLFAKWKGFDAFGKGMME